MIMFRNTAWVVAMLALGSWAQTLYPFSEYLPGYPGSWWKYVTDKGDTVTDSTQSAWELTTLESESPCFSKDPNQNAQFASLYDMGYLGFPEATDAGSGGQYGLMNKGRNGQVHLALFGKAIPYSVLQYCQLLTPIVSERIGDEIPWKEDIRVSGDRYRVVTHVDTTISLGGRIFDSVLVMEFRFGTPTGDSLADDANRNIQMYRKGVGLVYMRGYPDSTPLNKPKGSKTLLDHHIGDRRYPQTFQWRGGWGSFDVRIEGSTGLPTMRLDNSGNCFPPSCNSLCRSETCIWRGDVRGDTLIIPARLSSGLPPRLRILEGALDSLPPLLDSGWTYFRLLRHDHSAQFVRLGLSQPGDTTFRPREEFQAWLPLWAIPSFHADTASDGLVTLVSDADEHNVWGMGTPRVTAIPGATERRFIPSVPGVYWLSSNDNPTRGLPESRLQWDTPVSWSAQSYRLETAQSGLLGPVRANATAWIRFGQSRILLPWGRGPAPDRIRLYSIRGLRLAEAVVRQGQNGPEADLSPAPRSGAYLIQACAGRDCRSLLAALP